MKIETLTNPPDWFIQGQSLSADDIDWVTISARWYLGIAYQHGYPGVEDNRPFGDWEWDWRRCQVPIDLVWPETFSRQEEGRLNSIRTANPVHVPPIIVELLSDGKVRLLDGSHRMTVAKERILDSPTIDAYVGNPR